MSFFKYYVLNVQYQSVGVLGYIPECNGIVTETRGSKPCTLIFLSNIK